MDASLIGKNPDNLTKKDFETIVGATTQYISAWTQREFATISRNKKIPLIWPLPQGGYVIGSKRIIQKQGYWQLQNFDHECLYNFDSKQSAIFYCLCDYVKNYHLADTIRMADSEVKRLKNDVIHYENSMERAIKSKDSFGISTWSARLDDARLRLNYAQISLQKSIKSAKYLKVWTE
jgi:hypothetical protein